MFVVPARRFLQVERQIPILSGGRAIGFVESARWKDGTLTISVALWYEIYTSETEWSFSLDQYDSHRVAAIHV